MYATITNIIIRIYYLIIREVSIRVCMWTNEKKLKTKILYLTKFDNKYILEQTSTTTTYWVDPLGFQSSFFFLNQTIRKNIVWFPFHSSDYYINISDGRIIIIIIRIIWWSEAFQFLNFPFYQFFSVTFTCLLFFFYLFFIKMAMFNGEKKW